MIIPRRSVERELRTTHIRRSIHDARRMDLICHGIDGVFSGSPLFMDVTIVPPCVEMAPRCLTPLIAKVPHCNVLIVGIVFLITLTWRHHPMLSYCVLALRLMEDGVITV